MRIMSLDSGKNTGICIYDTETKEYFLKELNFKSSLDGFVNFQREFEAFLSTIEKIDKFVMEFSAFGIFNAQLSHYFYTGTIFGSISRFFGDNVYQTFPENKNAKLGVSAIIWQSYISGKLKIKLKEFSKDKSIEFANKLLESQNIKIKSDHQSDAVCIMYWYVNQYLKLT